MTAISITPGYPTFADTDGSPLNDGYVYIGLENQDPITAPTTAFWDKDFRIPADQPLRTSGGYVVRDGSPAAVYTGAAYSILVQNKNLVTVYNAPSAVITNVTNNVEEITQYQGAHATDPVARNDGTPLQTGDLYFNTVVNELKVWTGTVWVPAVPGTVSVENFTGTGAQTAFNLATAPVAENNTQIYIDGVYQQKDTYTLSGATINFSAAPPLNSTIEVVTFSISSLGTTDASNVSYNEGSAGAVNTSVQAKLQESVSVKDFGAVGDSSANDTVAVQAAFNSGSGGIYIPDGTYLIDEITVPATVQRIYGTGTLKQRATDTKLLVGSSIDGLIIEGLNLVGNYAAGQSVASSDNRGVEFTSCPNLRVLNCNFSNIQGIAIQLNDCEYPTIAGNKIELCGRGIYFRGCDNGTIDNNLIKDTILLVSVFTIGISLESTDGHAYGICNNITISGNVVKGYKNAQGIMGHTARNVSIVNNVVSDPATGISINPFNATDICSNISIVGNTVECETTISGYAIGNDGIIVQAGGSTPDVTDISISGNIVINANRATSNPSNQAGIRVGYARRVQVSGNTITAAKQSGIYLTDSEEGIAITGNTISSIIAEGGEQNGILVAAVSEGIISGNSFDTLNDASGSGIRLEASTQMTIGENSFQDVTNNVTGSGSEAPKASRTVTTGVVAPLAGVDVIYFNHSTPTTVESFSGVVVGKLYLFQFSNGNTTINRANAVLDGGTNKTGSAGDVMLMVGFSSTSMRQAAPMSVNS